MSWLQNHINIIPNKLINVFTHREGYTYVTDHKITTVEEGLEEMSTANELVKLRVEYGE